MNQTLIDIANDNKGFVTSKQAIEAGVQAMALTRAVRDGELERIGRGIYCTPETWEDEYFVASQRFGRGILSHVTALSLVDLIDRTPERITMTFPRGYNTSKVAKAGIIPRTVSKSLLELGATTVATPYGNDVRCYDAERSLCDMMRGVSSPDAQVLNPAMKSYLYSRKRDIAKLLNYAERLGVKDKVRKYVEVLL